MFAKIPLEKTAMATTKIYLDTRASKPGAEAPLKIRLTHQRQVCNFSLGIKLTPEQWDDANKRVISHKRLKCLNEYIRQRYLDIEIAILDTLKTKGRNISVQELKREVLRAIDPSEPESEPAGSGTFYKKFVTFADSRKSEGNKSAYRQTIRRLEAFDPDIRSKNFEDVTKQYLTDFDTFMSRTSKSLNAHAMHLRNIRAVFNDAIDDGVTVFYPFRKFKIRTQPTRKRSMSIEQIRTLMNYPCEEYQIVYRDMFMLMFYLCGINAVDLLNARPDAIVNGRLEYIRAKTHKSYSIKIESEAKVLIEKYRGKHYLLNIMDDRSNYKDFLHRMNKALKQIGEMERVGRGGKKVRQPMFPKLSQYWCRHTWATIAAELDIPKETIAAGLGHGGNTVTDIYIRFDQKKVDEANRRVIDYVLYDRR